MRRKLMREKHLDGMTCDSCGGEMVGAGGGWSSTKKYQQYRCTNPACLKFRKSRLNTSEPFIPAGESPRP